MMEEETEKRIEEVEDNLDKVMLENRDLDLRMNKVEEERGDKDGKENL